MTAPTAAPAIVALISRSSEGAPVTYVLSHYALFAALALALGLIVGWATCARGRDGRPGWLLWALGAFVVGLALALLKLVPGFLGHALEVALYLFAAYLVGCWLGCVLKNLFAGESTTAKVGEKAGGKPSAGAKATAGGKTAVGATAALAAGGAASEGEARARARADAKARAKAQAEAKSRAKFEEEEHARAKAEAERLAREEAEAQEKARRAAALAAQEEALARSGGVTAPARDFSVSKGDPLTLIARIGPHAESRLNALGIRKFAQIAAWTPSNGRWIDEKLGAPGRVAGEDWVAQARRLAAGETTDYARAVRSGAVHVDDTPPAPPKPDKTGNETDGDTHGAGRSAPKAAAAAGVAAAAAGASAKAEASKAEASKIGARAGAATAPASAGQETEPESKQSGQNADKPAAAPARPRVDPGHGGVAPAPFAARKAESGPSSATKAERQPEPAARAAPAPATPLVALSAPAAAVALAAPPHLDALPPPAPAVEGEGDYDGSRPQGFAAPRGGKADNLTLIRGIGRQNERKLHELGIWHFDQIAAWTAEQVKWVGAYLAFPGRIDREEWVAQAETLARGEVTEFARRVEKGDVPTSHE
jgi:predicted flap endonuclease-1-like 5' DNA nuclease